MRVLEIDISGLGWRKTLELDPDTTTAERHVAGAHRGTYLADSLDEVTVLAVHDSVDDEVVATVLFAGVPVLLVRSGGVGADGSYPHEVPFWVDDRGASAQAYAEFLVEIGEFPVVAPAYVAERGLAALYDADDAPDVGDGHDLVDFVGRVASAIHTAYPKITPQPHGW